MAITVCVVVTVQCAYCQCERLGRCGFRDLACACGCARGDGWRSAAAVVGAVVVLVADAMCCSWHGRRCW